MVSKTSLTESVRNHRWREVAQDLATRPDLLEARGDKGRGWLHLACMTPPAGDPGDSIRVADILLDLGLGIDAAAFTEGEWQATPLWHAISRGRNLALAGHLLKRGANPDFCLFAAAWNEDDAAIHLLLDHGANIEEGAERGDTPLIGAIASSKFGAAEALLARGANPDATDAEGRTALHLMLRKASAPIHFEMFARHGARGDIADREGNTAIVLLKRKRDPRYREIAQRLAG
jgi:ankyrin repeat protein